LERIFELGQEGFFPNSPKGKEKLTIKLHGGKSCVSKRRARRFPLFQVAGKPKSFSGIRERGKKGRLQKTYRA